MAAAVERIEPREARAHLESDSNTLLVCAYDDAEKCRRYHLEGAISLEEFQAQVDTLPKDQELIFYCA